MIIFSLRYVSYPQPHQAHQDLRFCIYGVYITTVMLPSPVSRVTSLRSTTPNVRKSLCSTVWSRSVPSSVFLSTTSCHRTLIPVSEICLCHIYYMLSVRVKGSRSDSVAKLQNFYVSSNREKNTHKNVSFAWNRNDGASWFYVFIHDTSFY